jgi:VanZ family protein
LRNGISDVEVRVKLHITINPDFRHGLLYGLPVILYAGLIFLLSSISQFSEEVSPFIDYDKPAHFIEYYLFGILICRWLLNKKNPIVKRHALFLTMLIGICYGVSDEWHQSFVPGRNATIWDVFFDAAGIVAAAFTYRITMKSYAVLNKLDETRKRKFTHEA